MSEIINSVVKKPVTTDGLCGFDEFGQFVLGRYDGERRVFTIGGADLRGKVCTLCNKAWTANSESLNDQMFVDAIKTHVHLACYIRKLAFEDCERYADALLRASSIPVLHDPPNSVDRRNYTIDRLPNEYWARADPWSQRAWYRFTFHRTAVPDAVIKIGRRKRVDEVSFERLTIAQMDELDKRFATLSVTKGRTDFGSYYIHCWGNLEIVQAAIAFFEVTKG